MPIHDPTPVEHRILSVLVENRAGVLAHVVGLFAARGFNIDSLAVGETEDPTMSRITLMATGDQRTMEQVKKQLNKLIDVIKVQDLSEEGFVDRELMLMKVKNTAAHKAKLEEMSKQYKLRVIENGPKALIVECTESRENTKKVFDTLKDLGIDEIAQTGIVALSKKT